MLCKHLFEKDCPYCAEDAYFLKKKHELLTAMIAYSESVD